MKNIKFYFLVLIFIFNFIKPSLLFAEVVHWPKINCELNYIEVDNLSSDPFKFWIQIKDKTNIEQEIAIELKPKSHWTYEVEFSDKDINLLNLDSKFQNNKNYKAVQNCLNGNIDQFYLNDISIDGLSEKGGHFIFEIFSQFESILQLNNLAYTESSFEINYLDENYQVIDHNKFNLQQKKSLTFKINTELQKIKNKTSQIKFISVTSSSRFNSYMLIKNYNKWINVKPKFIKPENLFNSDQLTSYTYFKVEPKNKKGDAFLIRTQNTVIIKKAREQLQNPKLEKIVFATIQLGNQNYNLNLNDLERPFWSWSVAEVTNISDLGSTTCNGFPQLVEDQLLNWVNSPQRICFWNYRITEEIKP